MANVTLLHISDLHYDKTDSNQATIIKEFLNDLKTNPLTSTCEFVAFSGDLVDKPSEENYTGVTNEFIIPLMNTLDLPLDHFLIVPGNHDCQLDDIEFSPETLLSSQQIDRFEKAIDSIYQQSQNGSKDIEKEIERIKAHEKHKFKLFLNFVNFLYQNGDSVFEHIIIGFSSAHILKCSNKKVGIACINSALICSGDSEAESGNIYIGLNQLKRLYSVISDCDVKIAILHHPISGTKIQDIDNISNFMYANFHLVLSGHDHIEKSYNTSQKSTSHKKEELFYNIASCLYNSYSTENQSETDYDPAYCFLKLDCDDLQGEAYYRKYYPFRKIFDIDLRKFENGFTMISFKKTNSIISSRNEPIALSGLSEPVYFDNITSPFEGMKEEDDGYNITFRGKTISNITYTKNDFSQYSLRQSKWETVKFSECLFSNTLLLDAEFHNCEFSKCKFISIDHFYSLDYCKENKYIAVAGEGNVVLILNTAEITATKKFKKVTMLYGVHNKIRSIAWRVNGEYLAAADQEGYLYIWKIDTPNAIVHKKIGEKPVYAVTWSPNGNMLTCTDGTGYKICVFSFNESEPNNISDITTLFDPNCENKHNSPILYAAWSNDSKFLATVGIDRNICIWNVENLETKEIIKIHASQNSIHSDYIRRVIWDGESTGFITCGDDGLVQKWKLSSNTSPATLQKISSFCVKPLEGNNEILSITRVSPEFYIAGLRDDDYAIISFNEERFSLIEHEKAHKGRVWDIGCAPDEKIVFTIGNGTITAWNFDEKHLTKICSYESKLNCTGLKMIRCKGLDDAEKHTFSVNKDIPESTDTVSTKQFLVSKGGTIC